MSDMCQNLGAQLSGCSALLLVAKLAIAHPIVRHGDVILSGGIFHEN